MEIRLNPSQRHRANAIIDQVQADPEIAAFELIYLRDKLSEGARTEWKLDRSNETQGGLLSLLHKNGIKPDSTELCYAIEQYADLLSSARELTEWLRLNVGDNADWPIAITSDSNESADKLSELLGKLGRAAHA